MKTYFLFKVSDLLMAFWVGLFFAAPQQTAEQPAKAEEAITKIAQQYTIHKLKPYTTALAVPQEKMKVNYLGNGYYKVVEQVSISFNSTPENLTYEISLHFNDDDLSNPVIDALKRTD